MQAVYPFEHGQWIEERDVEFLFSTFGPRLIGSRIKEVSDEAISQ
jgi:hypothetical protein